MRAFVPGSFDQAFAGQAMKRITYRRYAGIEVVTQMRRFETSARLEHTFSQLRLDGGIDPLEGSDRIDH